MAQIHCRLLLFVLPVLSPLDLEQRSTQRAVVTRMTEGLNAESLEAGFALPAESQFVAGFGGPGRTWVEE